MLHFTQFLNTLERKSCKLLPRLISVTQRGQRFPPNLTDKFGLANNELSYIFVMIGHSNEIYADMRFASAYQQSVCSVIRIIILCHSSRF